MSLPPSAARELRLQYQQILLRGLQIQQGKIEPHHARLLSGYVLERVRRCQAILAGAGVLPHQSQRQWDAFQDAERALVGFIDWAGRNQLPEQWEPIQTELYGNEKLGERVLSQMEALFNNPIPSDYPIEAMEAQARCLDLGYCGHAASRRMDPSQVDGLKRKLGDWLRRPPPRLAPPLADLPRARRFRPQVGPLWILGTALFLLLILGGGVRLAIHERTGEAAAQIQELLPANGCP